MPETTGNKEKADTGHITEQERNKLLWSLRSDFAWLGRKIPESVKIEGIEYRLQEIIRELGEKEALEQEKIAEIRALIPRLREKAKANEEVLENEALTETEANALFEEAAGLLRAEMELKDKLEARTRGEGDLKKMLAAQKMVDEKRWMDFIKQIK